MIVMVLLLLMNLIMAVININLMVRRDKYYRLKHPHEYKQRTWQE